MLYVGVEFVLCEDDLEDELCVLEFDLLVQYGDEIMSDVCKMFFKCKLIVEWFELVLFVSVQFIVCFVGENEGCMLNVGYCYKDYLINVLIFVYDVVFDGIVIGDLVLCCLVVEKEVYDQGKLFMVYYVYLLVYGVLYVQGYDYEISDEDVVEMEVFEVDIFVKLGFLNLYQ